MQYEQDITDGVGASSRRYAVSFLLDLRPHVRMISDSHEAQRQMENETPNGARTSFETIP